MEITLSPWSILGYKNGQMVNFLDHFKSEFKREFK